MNFPSVIEFARREVTAPPWDCDPLGPDAVCRMWLTVAAKLGVHVRDLPREALNASRAVYETEIARLR